MYYNLLLKEERIEFTMDGLGIIYMFLLLVSVLGIGLLFFVKNPKYSKISCIGVGLWSIIISFIHLSSLPSNYVMERLIAICFGVLGLIGLLLVLLVNKDRSIFIGKIVIAISVLLNLISLFL